MKSTKFKKKHQHEKQLQEEAAKAAFQKAAFEAATRVWEELVTDGTIGSIAGNLDCYVLA